MKIASLSPNLNAAFNIQTNSSVSSFSSMLTNKILQTNQELQAADLVLRDLSLGQVPNLHAFMLTIEQAKLTFQTLVQVRNRLMGAYQDLLREQI